jgi:putative transposase
MVGGSRRRENATKKTQRGRIIYALKQIEGGTKGLEMCLELGISEATLYNRKKRYAGMGLSDVRRLKQLEEENRQRLPDTHRRANRRWSTPVANIVTARGARAAGG